MQLARKVSEGTSSKESFFVDAFSLVEEAESEIDTE